MQYYIVDSIVKINTVIIHVDQLQINNRSLLFYNLINECGNRFILFYFEIN